MMAAIVFFFLALGAVAFTLCGLIPWQRKHALGAALWFAVWGPCMVAWLMFAGLAAIANSFAMQHEQWKQLRLPVPTSVLSGAFAICALMGTMLLASVAVWVHQALIHRMTLAFFRLYCALVSAGVGSVWGWCLLLWLGMQTATKHTALVWIPGMIVLCAGFGWFGFRFAKQLRGAAPQRLTWITKAEFEGVDA
jgi:hypothetical protein